MSGPYSQIDASGAFLANVILNKGRNEVQIYPISTVPGQLVVKNQIKRFELNIDQNVESIAWFNDYISSDTPQKSNKRSVDEELNGNGHSNGHSNGSSPQTNSLLAVSLSSGEVQLFSPFKDESTTASITSIHNTVSLTRSSSLGKFWALSSDAKVTEYDTATNSASRSFKFAKTDTEVTQIFSSTSQLKKLHGSPLLLASSRVYLVDGSKSKKQLISELSRELEGSQAAQKIAFLSEITENVVSVVRSESQTVEIHNLSALQKSPLTYTSRVGTITRVAPLSSKIAVLFGESGSEVIAVGADGISSLALIHTDHSTVQFENAFYTAANGVVGVWYDGNQPRFAKVCDDLRFSGDITVSIGHNRAATPEADVSVAEVTFVASEASQIDNLDSVELYRSLSALLLAKKYLKRSILKLCASNDNEDNIKDTIRHFSQTKQCPKLVERLFLTISHKVAADASRKLSLLVWLKWLLLAHGGYISRQEQLSEELKKVQAKLEDGMEMMPKLLALQGRLQLLKSQAELRERIRSQLQKNEVESDLEVEDTFNETFNNTTNIEELIVYANGENDDDFSISANGTLE